MNTSRLKKHAVAILATMLLLLPGYTYSHESSESKHGHKCCYQKEFDFIVVGGGISGCVLASRLSQCKHFKVLLIERGDNLEAGLQFEYQGPGSPNFDKYTQAVLNATQYYVRVQAFQTFPVVNNFIHYFYPKGLGGLSTMNDQIFNRGSQAFWDGLGQPDYTWANMLPYFKKIENASSVDGINPALRGVKGPLQIMSREPGTGPFPPNPDDQTMVNSISQALYGQPPLADYNAGNLIGIGPSQLSTTLLSNVAGVFPDKRQTVYSAYLDKLNFKEVAENIWRSKERKNLTIWTNIEVGEVSYNEQNGARTANGVLISGLGLIEAKKEVIVCAGALNTPHLLQNSHIDDFIPEVGQNLHDHIYLGWSSYEDSEPYPFGVKPSSYVLFASSDGSSDPDIMYHAVPTLRQKPTPPTFGFPPESQGWIPLFKTAADINKWSWQRALNNTIPLTDDPNTFALATTSTEDGFDILELKYLNPPVRNGALFTTNSDLLGAIGPYGIPSDIEIYLEAKEFNPQDSGIFFRVTGDLQNFQFPDINAFGGYQIQNVGIQQGLNGGGTGTFYAEYSQQGIPGSGPIYRWGLNNIEKPEQQNFTGWNSFRIQLRNIADKDLSADQANPLSTRITVWLNDVLLYDVIEANPQQRPIASPTPGFPQFKRSQTFGRLALQLERSTPVNGVIKYRKIAYRPLTAEQPAPREPVNYFDWRFYTYITRHPLRGTVHKTCCDAFAKPVIDGLLLNVVTNQRVLNPILTQQVLFAANFLQISAATNNRLKFAYNQFGLYNGDADLDPATRNTLILNQATQAVSTNPKDAFNYQNVAPYRIFPLGNRLGGSCSWDSVVDPSSLRVKTFQNLRICDASIIPVPFASDMQAPLMAIAERLSCVIQKQHKE